MQKTKPNRFGLFRRALPPLVLCAASPIALLASTPLVFTHTKHALPGDVIILQGADFIQGSDLPEVWIDEITGDSDAPTTEIRMPEVLSYSESFIHVRIPFSLNEGLYAVTVQCGSDQSDPVWINKAEPWQILDLAGTEIDPNRSFRISGWNLDLDGATPQVWFEDTASLTRTAGIVSDQNRANLAYVTAPSSLEPGKDYKLIVSNGYGESYGESDGPTLSCIPTPVDALNLGVPWADDFAFAGTNVYDVTSDPRLTSYAAGDGITDDSAAIQAACDKATAAGGGCVYLPAGTYLLGSDLRPKQNVVLRGAGMENTTLVGNIAPYIVHSTLGTTFYNGIMELTVTGGRVRMHSFQANSGPVFFVRARVDHEAGTGLDVRGIKTHLLVKDSELITRAIDKKGVYECLESQNILFQNNYVQWSDGRLEAGSCNNMQIDACTFARTVETDGVLLGYGGWEVSNCDYLSILDSEFIKLGEGPIPDGNDSETILNQYIPRFGAGYLTSATSTTISDTSESWITDELSDAGAYAVIISGPGAGQWRQISSNTSDTITVSPAWEVTPTSTSAYTITRLDTNWLIAGNTFNDCKRTIMLYSCSMTDVAIVDNDLINCFEINLRSDQRLFDTPHSRFNVFRNVLLDNNEQLNTNGVYPVQLSCVQVVPSSSESIIGNGFWDVVVRNNAIDTIRPNQTGSNKYGVYGEGYFAIGIGWGDHVGPAGLQGIVFDKCTAYDLDTAFHIDTGAVQTTFWKPVTDNIGTLVENEIEDGATEGATESSIIEFSKLYINSWDPQLNVSIDMDPITPVNFFDWLEFGTGTTTTGQFTISDSNSGNAAAQGGFIEFETLAGYNYAPGNAHGPDNFEEVVASLNTLPAGTYTLRLGFDYASNFTDDRYVKFLIHSDNDNKDSGGNDRWEYGGGTISSTNDLHSFSHFQTDYTITLVEPTEPAPRPEGSFEVGKLTGFSIRFYQDARQTGNPDLYLRIDNLSLDLL
ncbi:glycosyl hydrolase family 28-related protein [Coraliomargarita parva]|uniref:glycosyl hydrolase family 28-related protein n=1 Tax=Coraliomargarita parva TaxID=3014050 RepID=UPI0022B35BAC|nr:glycosyl hydrolase family 28-related protein [Coraliomargarita parva]